MALLVSIWLTISFLVGFLFHEPIGKWIILLIKAVLTFAVRILTVVHRVINRVIHKERIHVMNDQKHPVEPGAGPGESATPDRAGESAPGSPRIMIESEILPASNMPLDEQAELAIALINAYRSEHPALDVDNASSELLMHSFVDVVYVFKMAADYGLDMLKNDPELRGSKASADTIENPGGGVKVIHTDGSISPPDLAGGVAPGSSENPVDVKSEEDPNEDHGVAGPDPAPGAETTDELGPAPPDPELEAVRDAIENMKKPADEQTPWNLHPDCQELFPRPDLVKKIVSARPKVMTLYELRVARTSLENQIAIFRQLTEVAQDALNQVNVELTTTLETHQ